MTFMFHDCFIVGVLRPSADTGCQVLSEVAIDGVVQFVPDVTITVHDSGDWAEPTCVFCKTPAASR